ncbi:hypothetical protein [Ignavibacterium album]|uniref:hypothetical protein n=1 Tax=Ignavibacterium album TaxID=591197 RepID=UPI0026EC9562|nr:hypothetical protein [Ignavibacterium album]
MNDYLFWWETKINTFRANCSTYNNIFYARKGGFNMYMYAYSTLITYFRDAHDRFTGAKPENKLRRGRNEKRTNNKPEV